MMCELLHRPCLLTKLQMPTYLALSRTCRPTPTFFNCRFAILHVFGEFSYTGIVWTKFPNDWFFLTFPLALLADCKVSHSLDYSDKSLSQGYMFSRELKVFFANLEPYSVWNLWLIILCVGTISFPFSKATLKTDSKARAFFSWATQSEWFMVNTFPYISMNEQIHIEKSLLTCIYFWNQFPLTFLIFKSTSKIPHTHTYTNTRAHTQTNTKTHKTWANA